MRIYLLVAALPLLLAAACPDGPPNPPNDDAGSCDTSGPDSVTLTWSCSADPCTGGATETIESNQGCGINGAGCLVPSVADDTSTVNFSLCPYAGVGDYGTATASDLSFFLSPGTCAGGGTADFQPDTTGGECDVVVDSDCESGGVHRITGTFSCGNLAYANVTCAITGGTFTLTRCSL